MRLCHCVVLGLSNILTAAHRLYQHSDGLLHGFFPDAKALHVSHRKMIRIFRSLKQIFLWLEYLGIRPA
jgi:hypothetical protein